MATDSTSGFRDRARRSSLPSDGGLFGGIYGRGGAAEQASGRAWLQALLDAEAALARACASEGLVSAADAEAVAAACSADNFDLAALAGDAAEHASPVVPLVR